MPEPLELTIHIDGAARGNPGPAAYGCVFYHNGEPLLEESGYLGTATNNVAEYSALVHALAKAAELKATSVLIRSDSELLVKQMNGEYRVKNPALAGFHREASQLARQFREVRYSHVAREQNREADRLCNEVLDQARRGAPPAKRPALAPPPQPPPRGKTAADDKNRWEETLLQVEQLLRRAAVAWAEDGIDEPTPREVAQQVVELFEQSGFLKTTREGSD